MSDSKAEWIGCASHLVFYIAAFALWIYYMVWMWREQASWFLIRATVAFFFIGAMSQLCAVGWAFFLRKALRLEKVNKDL